MTDFQFLLNYTNNMSYPFLLLNPLTISGCKVSISNQHCTVNPYGKQTVKLFYLRKMFVNIFSLSRSSNSSNEHTCILGADSGTMLYRLRIVLYVKLWWLFFFFGNLALWSAKWRVQIMFTLIFWVYLHSELICIILLVKRALKHHGQSIKTNNTINLCATHSQ